MRRFSTALALNEDEISMNQPSPIDSQLHSIRTDLTGLRQEVTPYAPTSPIYARSSTPRPHWRQGSTR